MSDRQPGFYTITDLSEEDMDKIQWALFNDEETTPDELERRRIHLLLHKVSVQFQDQRKARA